MPVPRYGRELNDFRKDLLARVAANGQRRDAKVSPKVDAEKVVPNSKWESRKAFQERWDIE
jgi:hypothetical protein